MKTYTTEIHLSERKGESNENERFFDGYLAGGPHLLDNMGQRFAMTSTQAIAYCVEVERIAFAWGNTEKTDVQGQRIEAKCETIRVYDNF